MQWMNLYKFCYEHVLGARDERGYMRQNESAIRQVAM